MNILWSREAATTWLRCEPTLRKTILLRRSGSCCTSSRASSNYFPTIPRLGDPDGYRAPANSSLPEHPILSHIGFSGRRSRFYVSTTELGGGLIALSGDN
jgi:hypothetical protein